MAHIGLVTLLVSDYDEAIDFYVNRWDLIQPGTRPPGRTVAP
jgi:catechol 2,3-dioxygenase-like lactoylglutathione lyase family enzyme